MFSETVQRILANPPHLGPLEGATHRGVAGVPGDGPYLILWLEIREEQICRAAFQTYGCPSAVASGSNTLVRFTLAYDPVGNVSTILDSNGATTIYSYDAKNRLTQDTTTGTNAHAYTYSYDGNDNRLSSSETGAVILYAYDAASRLVTSVSGSGTTSYSFDTNGNLTKVQKPADVTTMVYDKENRLARHENGGVTSTYAYSADGLKRSEQVGGVTTTLIWDGSAYLQARS